MFQLEWQDIRTSVRLAERRPRFHELAALVEEISAPIGSFRGIFHHMGQRHFTDFAGEIRAFRSPIPEGASHAVGGRIIPFQATQQHQERHVREGSGVTGARKYKGLMPAHGLFEWGQRRFGQWHTVFPAAFHPCSRNRPYSLVKINLFPPCIQHFTGAGGLPTAMEDSEIDRMLRVEEAHDEPAKIKIQLSRGDVVKIKEGTFDSFEGAVESIDDTSGKIIVLIEIFGRSTPVELEYWQVEKP